MSFSVPTRPLVSISQLQLAPPTSFPGAEWQMLGAQCLPCAKHQKNVFPLYINTTTCIDGTSSAEVVVGNSSENEKWKWAVCAPGSGWGASRWHHHRNFATFYCSTLQVRHVARSNLKHKNPLWIMKKPLRINPSSSHGLCSLTLCLMSALKPPGNHQLLI